MNIQSLSEVRSILDVFDERFYNLKEALLFKNGDTKDLEKEYRYAATEVMLALKKNIAIRNAEEKEIVKEAYQKRLLEIICNTYKIDEKKLLISGGSRKKEFKEPRQIHMALLHKVFGVSQAKAAGIYGLDHATCIHAFKTIRNYYQTDKQFRNDNWGIIEHCISYDDISKENLTMEYLNEKTK